MLNLQSHFCGELLSGGPANRAAGDTIYRALVNPTPFTPLVTFEVITTCARHPPGAVDKNLCYTHGMAEPRTVTISLPPELAARVDEVAGREGRSRSELFREAARQYLRRQERWERIFAYGERVAARVGIDNEDQVAEVVTERRRRTRRAG